MNEEDELQIEELQAELIESLRKAWADGWQPMEVFRLFNKLPVPKAIFVDCLTVDRLSWHSEAGSLWTDQADSVGAGHMWWDRSRPYWPQFRQRHDDHSNSRPDLVATSVELFRTFVGMLRVQPLFEAPPNERGWDLQATTRFDNDGILAKVRALLAKAEASEFEHEAEMFSAKAQQLIARHSIDVALLADQFDVPGGRKVFVEAPYAKAKFMLLSGIARANNCRSVWTQRSATATLVGHQADLFLVDLLFTSLLLQGTGAILAGGPIRSGGVKSQTRSWRNAFWYGYSDRIGQRLGEAVTQTQTDVDDQVCNDLLPVLVNRSAAVEKTMSELFPKLGTIRTSFSNGEGLVAGRDFANRAQLDSKHQVRQRSQLQLTP